MNTYKYIAVAAFSSILVITSTASAADSSVKPSQIKQCKDRTALIKKEYNRIQTEYYGKTIDASYDGGLQEKYLSKYTGYSSTTKKVSGAGWVPRRDSYHTWVYKSDPQKYAIDLTAVDNELKEFDKTEAAVADVYMQQRDAFHISKVPVVDANGKSVLCVNAYSIKSLNTYYQKLQDERKLLRAEKTKLTVAANRVVAKLNAARNKRDDLIRKHLIVKKGPNFVG